MTRKTPTRADMPAKDDAPRPLRPPRKPRVHILHEIAPADREDAIEPAEPWSLDPPRDRKRTP